MSQLSKGNSLALFTILVRKENAMKKHVILMIVMMFMIIPSVVMADEDEKEGREVVSIPKMRWDFEQV